MHASVSPRLRRLIVLSCLLFAVASQAFAQQVQQQWPPQYTNTPTTQATPQTYTPQPPPQRQAQPFAAPPQQLPRPAEPLVTITPTTNTQPSQPVGAVTPITPSFENPVEQPTASEKAIEPADEGEAKSDDDFAEELAQKAEQAKSTVTKALFENNHEAQLSLAKDYLLPIVAILLVMLAAVWVGNRLRDRVSEFVSRRVDVTLGRFAGMFTKVSIIVCALLGVLSSFSVEMTSLAAVIAAIGFAVGMALQGTLGNFASGIALLVFRPFNVGDYIVVDGTAGTVQAIELFTTAIDTPDNRHIIIPNESVFGNKIENWTHNKQRRIEVMVGVSYSADMKHTRRVLLDALATVDGALPNPAPSVHLCELNASSVDWSCRVWCRTSDFLAVKERVTEAVKESLDRHGIGIPFPQLDLHVVAPAKQQRSAAA